MKVEHSALAAGHGARDAATWRRRSTAIMPSSCIWATGSAASSSIGTAPTSICARTPWIANGPRRYLAEYLKKGWISDFIPDRNPSPPYAGGKAGAATTLEYSWDDHALALYAKKLGKEDDYQMFLKRAHNYRTYSIRRSGSCAARPRTASGFRPSIPREPYYNFMMKEASGWSTLWLVPHDVQGLIDLLGGREKFDAKLDEFFNTPYHPKGICRDCTGMIGQYVQGNQPDQQAAYYYDWGGQPWKTQELTRRILKLMYGSDKYGLAFPGMDDQGSTSSWYVLSAMGFYPVDPVEPGLHHRQPDLRRGDHSPGQRQGLRDRRQQQFGEEHVYPVGDAEREAVEQAVVQPLGYCQRREAGAQDGPKPNKIGAARRMRRRRRCRSRNNRGDQIEPAREGL